MKLALELVHLILGQAARTLFWIAELDSVRQLCCLELHLAAIGILELPGRRIPSRIVEVAIVAWQEMKMLLQYLLLVGAIGALKNWATELQL